MLKRNENFKVLATKNRGYFIVYFISAFIILGFSFLAIILFTTIRQSIKLEDVIFLMVVPIYLSGYAVLILTNLLGINSGRIFIEVTNEFIKYNKVFGSKIIKLSDIDVIRKAPYEKTLAAIIMTEKGMKKKLIKRKIRIPEIWFEDKDIENY